MRGDIENWEIDGYEVIFYDDEGNEVDRVMQVSQ